MNKSIRLFGFSLVAAFVAASCTTKIEDSVDPAIFGGTWNGTLTCSGMAPVSASVTIGMDGNTANLEGISGGGACRKTVTYTGTLFNDHIDFKPQLMMDECGNSNSFSGSAYVHDEMLSLSESFSGVGYNTTCKFEGYK